MPELASYYMRRMVSWCAHHIGCGGDLDACLRAGAKRRPPLPPELIQAAYPTALEAVRNASRFSTCEPGCRICDIPGIVLPNEE